MTGDDPLQAMEERVELRDHSSSSPAAAAHLKTYTAGEDKSRLQQAAKELGLQQARKPRQQVRKQKSARRLNNAGQVLQYLLLDSTTEDARMLSVYSSHQRLDEQEMALLQSNLPEWMLEAIAEEEEEEEEDFDVHAHGVGGDLVSAVLGIIKGMVGPAILYLPHGFAGAGYVLAVPIMIMSTALFLYSSTCLLESWRLESTKAMVLNEATGFLMGRPSRRPVLLSYPELAYRGLGAGGETLVKSGIALMQSGVCLTYLIFVPQNLHASILILTGLDISPSLLLLVMIAIQIPLSWIRDIRKLTPTNLLANCLILYGLGTCLVFAVQTSTSQEPNVGPVREIWHHLSHLEPFAKDWFLFIGTSVSTVHFRLLLPLFGEYCFESSGLSLLIYLFLFLKIHQAFCV